MSMYPPPSQFHPPKPKSLLRRHPVLVTVSMVMAVIVGVIAGCEATIAGSPPGSSQEIYTPVMMSAPTGKFTPRGKEVYPIRPSCR